MDLQIFDQVRQLAASHFLVAALHAVAQFGVADALDEPVAIATLAARTGTDADALGRVLRLLSSRGIFVLEAGQAGHSPASRLLRADHPLSVLPLVRMFSQEVQWRAAAAFAECLRTGEAATPKLYDGGFWGYMQQNPESERVFGQAMRAKALVQIQGIIDTHDFSPYRRIVDVGGGQGHLLRAILARHPDARAVLFDQPAVIEAARGAGSGERLDFVAGDFFQDVPGGDAVILMEILHDWADPEAIRILQTVRRAMPPDGRLLVIETEVEDGPAPDWAKMLDLVMLAQFASRQRTRDGYAALLAAAGFAMTKAVDTGAEISVIEARPV